MAENLNISTLHVLLSNREIVPRLIRDVDGEGPHAAAAEPHEEVGLFPAPVQDLVRVPVDRVLLLDLEQAKARNL